MVVWGYCRRVGYCGRVRYCGSGDSIGVGGIFTGGGEGLGVGDTALAEGVVLPLVRFGCIGLWITDC